MNNIPLTELIKIIQSKAMMSEAGGFGNVSNRERQMFANANAAMQGQGNVGNVSDQEMRMFQGDQRRSYMDEIMNMRNNAPTGGQGQMSLREQQDLQQKMQLLGIQAQEREDNLFDQLIKEQMIQNYLQNQGM